MLLESTLLQIKHNLNHPSFERGTSFSARVALLDSMLMFVDQCIRRTAEH